jgi:uncharacterized protein
MTGTETETKAARLESILREMGSLTIGLSGGTDSSLLAVTARRVLGRDSVLAVTARAPIFAEHEMDDAREIVERFDVPHMVVEVDPLADPRFVANPPDRCYHCKFTVFAELKEVARDRGLNWVADGTNLDDVGDYRPGLKASDELGVRHPLKEAGLTKAEIRALSRELGLPTSDKPPAACLASRFAYGQQITEDGLLAVGRAEDILRRLGYRQCRARAHGTIARIELGRDEDPGPLLREANRREIVATLKEYGFLYVTLDLEGYRTGSLNEALRASDNEGD